jgi:solute carrier family 25 (mitochondrial folate transporter), member 32
MSRHTVPWIVIVHSFFCLPTTYCVSWNMTLNRTTMTVVVPKQNSFLPVTTPPPSSSSSSSLPPRNIPYIWSSLFAGIGSGALSSMVCAPLDVMRTRMQVWGDVATSKEGIITTTKGNLRKAGIWKLFQSIRQQEGIRGYFRGLGATLATVPMFWGLYFPLYEDMKRTLAHYRTNSYFTPILQYPSFIHGLSAISAGAIADIVCNPMFVVRTRLQTEALHGNHHTTILQTVAALYREGGLLIFWRGLTASMMGLSHVGVQFPVYEWLKKEARILRHNKPQISTQSSQHPTSWQQQQQQQRDAPLDLLLASALSKMTASLLTYPHEVIRSRMMDSRLASEASLGMTCRRIWVHEGWTGFYSGLHVSLLRVVPNCCVTFLTYELLLQFAKDNLI